MSPTGHDGESRLDRLERLFEVYAERNERAHQAFEEEHKRLLTAQVVMVDNMSKLELKLDEVADKLDGLIGIVADLLKKNNQ